MENLEITWETILVIAGGVIVLIDAYKRLISFADPIKDLKSKQYDVDEKLKTEKQRIDELDHDMEEIRKYQEDGLAVIGLAVAELLNHTITGNDIKALKAREEDLNSFFYKIK